MFDYRMLGPGKYDDVATSVRDATVAQGVIVAVFDGHRGSGLSVQANAWTLAQIPHILRQLADQIEQDTVADSEIYG